MPRGAASNRNEKDPTETHAHEVYSTKPVKAALRGPSVIIAPTAFTGLRSTVYRRPGLSLVTVKELLSARSSPALRAAPGISVE